MLSEQRCATMVPASDIDRAKRWYSEKLALQPDSDNAEGVRYSAGGGTEFWLYPSQFAGTNQATTMSWLVDDVAAEKDELRSRGVTFEEYDMPDLKTVDGVAEFEGGRAAWFKDSEGNILSIVESTR